MNVLSRKLENEFSSSGKTAIAEFETEAVENVSSDVKRWLTLAVGSLVIAGLLSLFVVLGRLPFLSQLIDDPMFFKRCLVVHVNLSLAVWFYSFVACLLAMRFRADSGRLGRGFFYVSVVGVFAMLAGALARGAEPVLSNYIPMIDHPLFLSGIAVFFAGIIGFILLSIFRNSELADGGLPIVSGIGLQASCLMVLIAAVTWVAAVSGLPSGLESTTFYEFANWGAGHALQVANVCAMLAVWLWALERATGSSVVSLRFASLLFGLLIIPHFVLPLLTMNGTMDSLYHTGATQLMRWGIFPVVLTFFVLCCRHLRANRNAVKGKFERSLIVGFWASSGLTLLGIGLGACIRSSTTLVPAHYHASLGGVTVAFMTAAFLVASVVKGRSGLKEGFWKQSKLQLLVFGIGQAVFALGFGLGGLYGLGRKTYASEQHVRSMGEYIGLTTMGLGGLVAMVGGVWFLVLILREMRTWWSARSAVFSK